MTGSGGGLRACGSLMLLGLCVWTGARAAVPNPVSNLRAQTQTNSSISLSWEAPEGLGPNYTYWVQWARQGDNVTASTRDTNYTAGGLEPESWYEFAVWVQEGQDQSHPLTLRAATAPNSVRNLRVGMRTNSSIALTWEVPDRPDLLNYTYWVQWTGGSDETKNQSTVDTRFTLEGLEPGTLYQVSVWAEKNGVAGSRQNRSISTAPNAVRSLRIQDQSTNSITLSWIAPQGPGHPPYIYRVSWFQESGIAGIYSTTDTGMTLRTLSAGSMYTFTVWAERNGVSSDNETLTGATAPTMIRALQKDNQTNSSITLRWEAPDDPRPHFYQYVIQWADGGHAQREQDPQGHQAYQTHKTNETWYVVKALEPGTLYNFSVWAERSDVAGSTQSLRASTAPTMIRALQKDSQTNSSITLRWEAPDDPSPHFYVYVVQWADGGHSQREQDPQGHQAYQTHKTNKTWYVVKALEPGTLYNFSVWAERSDVAGSTQSLRASTDPDPVIITSCDSTSGGYGISLTWSCPMGGYEAFELQVGGQLSSQDRASCGRGISVSGLQPAQSYSATITTIWDGLRAPPAFVTCHTESAGVIAGAVVGVLLFIILVGLLIFFLKKRYKKTQKNLAPRRA